MAQGYQEAGAGGPSRNDPEVPLQFHSQLALFWRQVRSRPADEDGRPQVSDYGNSDRQKHNHGKAHGNLLVEFRFRGSGEDGNQGIADARKDNGGDREWQG